MAESKRSTVKLGQVVDVLKSFAPTNLAGSWDNVGLLVEPSNAVVSQILLTIDLTEQVLDEAIKQGCSLIIAYHPPIFSALKRLTQSDPKQRIIVKAIENKIAVYSPHTSLDAIAGGVNDWLASGLGELAASKVVEPHTTIDPNQAYKVVVFVPEKAADKLRAALSAQVKAGVIGNYSQCSFNLRGVGTFFGEAEANPTVGKAGKLETVDEIRLEMVCGKDSLALLTSVIKDNHPYEEPAFEVYALQSLPSKTVGQGRLVTLKEPVSLATLIGRVKQHCALSTLRVATAPRHKTAEVKTDTVGKQSVASPTAAAALVKSVALCAGSGSSVINGLNADVLLTGEMGHHDVLGAVAQGKSVILCEHSNSERGYLQVFKSQLIRRFADAKLDGLTVSISTEDQDPLKAV